MNEKNKKLAEQEGDILKKLKHDNIISLKGLGMTGTKINIMMEHAEGGSLAQRISQLRKEGKFLSEKQILIWFEQICKALKYVHGLSIIHRDIKPANVLLDKDDNIKVADFGISGCTDKIGGKVGTTIGTKHYVAPEVLDNKKYCKKVDAWSVGVLLYELCTLKPLVSGSTPLEVKEFLKSFTGVSTLPSRYSSALKSLINHLLAIDPNERFSISEALEYLKTKYAKKNSKATKAVKNNITLPNEYMSMKIDNLFILKASSKNVKVIKGKFVYCRPSGKKDESLDETASTTQLFKF